MKHNISIISIHNSPSANTNNDEDCVVEETKRNQKKPAKVPFGGRAENKLINQAVETVY